LQLRQHQCERGGNRAKGLAVERAIHLAEDLDNHAQFAVRLLRGGAHRVEILV